MTAVRSRGACHFRASSSKFPYTPSAQLVRPSSGYWILHFCGAVLLAAGYPGIAQQQQPPQRDPENERRWGIWFDEGISSGLSPDKSLEFEFHQRLDERASNLFEYFFQGGIRLLLNVNVSAARGRWRPNLRTPIEGRFPQNRIASARIRFRPAVEYTLLPMTRRPLVVINNEFFIVLGANSFASAGTFTQDGCQAGIRLPITESVAIRPYYLRQWVNPPTGWNSNAVLGISLSFKF